MFDSYSPITFGPASPRSRDSLDGRLAEERVTLDEPQREKLAHALFDALTLAGGLSVPSVIAKAIALPRSEWGQEHLPTDFSLGDASKLEQYVWEVGSRK